MAWLDSVADKSSGGKTPLGTAVLRAKCYPQNANMLTMTVLGRYNVHNVKHLSLACFHTNVFIRTALKVRLRMMDMSLVLKGIWSASTGQNKHLTL